MAREVNQLSGIIEVTFDLPSRMAAVTYDPGQVNADAVREAIATADRQMAEDEAASPDVQSLLGKEQREEGS